MTNKKRFFAVFCFLLLFFTISSSLFAPKAYAADNINTTVKKFFKLQAFRECMNITDGASEKLVKGESKTIFGSVYEGVTWVPNSDTVTVGYVVDASDGSNGGEWACGISSHADEWFKLIGYKGFSDFRDQNYKSTGNNFLEPKNGKNALDKEIRDAISKNMPDITGYMRYYNFYASFKRCASGPKNKNDIKDSELLQVTNYVDLESGKVTKDAYFQNKTGDEQIPVGHYAQGDRKPDDGKIVCSNIAKELEKYADSYKTWFDKNQDEAKAAAGGATAVGENEPDNSCEANTGVMAWIGCPLIDLIGGTLNWVDTQVSRLLEVDENKISNDQMYTAWSTFRNIALSLLVAAMLVMVISTALGLSFLDAYTVKKAFPRLVISIIFILLSWNFCIFMIELFNAIGKGTLGLMTAPFNVSSLSSLYEPSVGGSAIQIAGLAIAGTSLLLVGALGILMSWLGAAMLIMAIAFITLVARQMFIIVLVLFSPLAILAWIFPNSEKLWKFWWSTFTKLLIMYPMVMALIAAGRIFASVIAGTDASGAEGGLLSPLLKITAYVLPYLFIPFTFKAAGGVFGNLAGMANDRSKGALDRLKKGRQKTYGQMGRNIKGGVGFRGSNGSMLNRTAAGVAAGPRGWRPGQAGREYRGAKRETGAVLAGAGQLEDNATYKANKGNDAFLMAMADDKMLQSKIDENNATLANVTDPSHADYGDAVKAAEARASIANLERARALAKTVPNQTAATRRQAGLDLAASGYQFSAGEDGYNELARMAQTVSGYDAITGKGDRAAYENFMDNAQFNLGKAGRFDLAGINHGAGYDPKTGTDKASLYELANAKKQSITGMASTIPETGPLSSDQMEQAAILHKELTAMRPNAKGATAGEIDKQLARLEAQGVDSSYLSTPSGRTSIDPTTGIATPITRTERVDFDSARATADPTYAAGWSTDEQARGWKSRTRLETMGDVAQEKARTYQPPDPNVIP